MFKKSYLTVAMALIMVLALLTGCAAPQPTAAPAAAAPAAPAQSETPAAAGDPILIGAVLPISVGDMGWHQNKGIELAVNQANARGGVIGRQIELVVEDDAGKPDTCIKAVKLLIDREVDCIVGPHHSANTLAIADLLNEYGHPEFTTSGGASLWDKVKNDGIKWIFASRSNDAVSARALVTWCLPQGYKDIGIITDTGAWPSNLATSFATFYESKDPNIKITREEFTAGDKDFTAQLTKLMNKEAIFVSGYSNDTANIAAQIKRIGYTGQVLASSAAGVAYFPGLVGTDADGWIGETNYVAGASDIPEALAFEKAFFDAYGQMPSETGAAQYDATNLYLAAVEKAGSVEPDAVRTALLEMKDYSGVQGPLTYFKTGELGNRRLIFTLEGGKYKVVDILETDYNPDAP